MNSLIRSLLLLATGAFGGATVAWNISEQRRLADLKRLSERIDNILDADNIVRLADGKLLAVRNRGEEEQSVN